MNQYLIVCPLVFLAGLIDSIAGGGGLISLPAYLAAGIPPHLAIGTNKMDLPWGLWFLRHGLQKTVILKVKLSLCAALLAIGGSVIGAHLSMLASETVLKTMMLVALPVVAFYVLKNKDLGEQEKKGSI